MTYTKPKWHMSLVDKYGRAKSVNGSLILRQNNVTLLFQMKIVPSRIVFKNLVGFNDDINGKTSHFRIALLKSL